MPAPGNSSSYSAASYYGSSPASPIGADIPDWLQKDTTGPLKQFQGQLGSYFNLKPLQAASEKAWDSAFDQQRLVANSASTAATRRAALSGGGVGASYGAASSLLPLYGMRDQSRLDYARLAAQLKGQRGALAGQTANQLGDQQGGDRDALMRYLSGQQSFNQHAYEYDQGAAFQQDQTNYARNQAALAKGGGGMGRGNSYGYIPNQGPITGAMVNGQYQPNNAYTPESFNQLYNGYRNGNLSLPSPRWNDRGGGGGGGGGVQSAAPQDAESYNAARQKKANDFNTYHDYQYY